MKKLATIVGGLVLGAGLCLAARAAEDAPPLTGTWSLNNWTPGDGVRLTLNYRKARTRWEWGSGQPIADLHGLTSDQLHAPHASVAFTLQRDAGTFTFEGTLLLGIGRGDYRFVSDPTYAAKLSALGYGPIGDDAVSIMLMAVRDVSLEFAAEVKSSGLEEVEVSDLVRLQDHGIDGAYLRALKTSGASDLSSAEVIKLHDHGVRPDYVARIHSAGYGDLTVDQIIKLHDHGVD
jgi:hypothetical protein